MINILKETVISNGIQIGEINWWKYEEV